MPDWAELLLLLEGLAYEDEGDPEVLDDGAADDVGLVVELLGEEMSCWDALAPELPELACARSGAAVPTQNAIALSAAIRLIR